MSATRTGMALSLAVLLFALPAFAEKQSPPSGGTPRDFKLPRQHSFTLDNGLSAVLVPYGTLPKVAVSVKVRSGNLNEQADQVWLADLTSDLIEEGTVDKDANTLAAAFGTMGGELNLSTGSDVTTLGTDVLAEFGPDAVRLLAEVVRRPALPASELERKKDDLVRGLSIAMSQPQSQANRKFAELLYGEHPYGRMYPSEEMIRGYSMEDVGGFYKNNFGAKRTRVYVVGVFDAAAMEQAIRESFGDWAAGPEIVERPPEMKSERLIHLIQRPEAPQSTLRIGLPVVEPSHPDHEALQLTNTLLGGFFSSRVTSNIREDKGYTYSPYSDVSTYYRAAHWVQNADVSTEVTGAALKEILHEIDKLQAEAPSEEELDGVKAYMAGVFVLQNSSRFGIVGQLAQVYLHGLDQDYLTGYVKRLYAVTPAEVQRLAKEHIRDEDMTIVVVGDRAKIESQLEPFGKLAN